MTQSCAGEAIAAHYQRRTVKMMAGQGLAIAGDPNRPSPPPSVRSHAKKSIALKRKTWRTQGTGSRQQPGDVGFIKMEPCDIAVVFMGYRNAANRRDNEERGP